MPPAKKIPPKKTVSEGGDKKETPVIPPAVSPVVPPVTPPAVAPSPIKEISKPLGKLNANGVPKRFFVHESRFTKFRNKFRRSGIKTRGLGFAHEKHYGCSYVI